MQCSAEHSSTQFVTKRAVDLMIKSAAAGPRAYIAVATNPGSSTDVAATQMWQQHRCGSNKDVAATQVWQQHRYGSSTDVAAQM